MQMWPTMHHLPDGATASDMLQAPIAWAANGRQTNTAQGLSEAHSSCFLSEPGVTAGGMRH